MELRILQYFLAVIQEENISKAAETLHITQPTLSRQLQQLEEELGVKLFQRGKHLTLTNEGILLKRRAEEVVALMHKIDDEFEKKGEISGEISIGTGGLFASHKLAEVISDFHQKYPKVKFQIYTNSADNIKERIEQGLLDFGLLLEPVDITKFDYIRTKEKERWGVFMHRNHPLATKPYITKDDLKDIPLVISDRLPVQNKVEQWLQQPLSSLDIIATYNIITNVAMLISKNVASALTIEGAVTLFDHAEMVFKPLYPELTMSSVLAWKKYQPNFTVANVFLEYYKSML